MSARAGERPGDPILAQEGWAHYGCATCGLVAQWPGDRQETPICSHTGRLTWLREGEPIHPTWTEAVPVEVVCR